MCGRYAMKSDPAQILEIMKEQGFKIDYKEKESKVKPGLNKAPQSYAIVCRQNEETKKLELVTMKWTLQPSWAHKSVRYPTFNTRCESLDPSKSAWKCAKHRRGILPMQGYYEWDQHTHLPYYIHRKHHTPIKIEEPKSETNENIVKAEETERPVKIENEYITNRHASQDKSKAESSLLYCLVVWDVNTQLCEVPTFSIVTGPAVPRSAAIHDRMPVILNTREEAEEWMEGKWPDVLKLIQPNNTLEAYRVAKDVGRVGVEKPDLNSPLQESKPNTVTDFFSPKKRRKSEEETGHKSQRIA